MKRNNKSVENILLIALFVFASIGTYVVFANSNDKSDREAITKPTLYVKNDFSKYNTAKPKIKQVKATAKK